MRSEYDEMTKYAKGWTLPFTWILLIAAGVLIYAFGWIVLAYAAGLVVSVTLGVMVYDRLYADSARPGRIDDFWLVSGKPTLELANMLRNAGLIGDFEIGAESVWEWIDVNSTIAGHALKISRKHRDPTFPVHIRVFHSGPKTMDETREEWGAALSAALECDVRVGVVDYLGGNEYEFREERVFRSTASSSMGT